MAQPVFDRETLLDALVNIVPLGILLFFTALFLLVQPWTDELSLVLVMQHVLIAVPFVGLTLITYLAAKHL